MPQELPGIPRLRAGDVIENSVTGERVVVLIGSGESRDGSIAGHLFVRPGGAVAVEHVHATVSERFRVIEGRLGVRIGGRESVLEKGADVTITPGVAHDWWNPGPGEAQVLVEVEPGRRFELMLSTLFGLANDRLTNSKGVPHLLQLAVIAREFRDVIEFVKPPRILQRAHVRVPCADRAGAGLPALLPPLPAPPRPRPAGPGRHGPARRAQAPRRRGVS